MEVRLRRDCPELDLENQGCGRIDNGYSVLERPFGAGCSACLAALYRIGGKEELRLASFLAQHHVFFLGPRDNDSGVFISHISALRRGIGSCMYGDCNDC